MGSRLVKQDGVVFHLASELVTVLAGNIHVAPFQREIRASLVVKQGWFPPRRIVATVAAGARAVSDKLSAMRILVTAFTSLGSGVVNHVLHGDFQVRWLMAIDAGHRPVGAGEDERS